MWNFLYLARVFRFISSQFRRKKDSLEGFKPLNESYVNLGPADQDVSFFSKLTFSWVFKLLQKGNQCELNEIDDLFELPKSLQVVENEKKLIGSLLRNMLWKAFGREFFLIGFLRLFADILKFACPILLTQIIVFVEDKTQPMYLGYLYASGMFVSVFFSAVFNCHFNYLAEKLSLKVIGGLSCAIFKKIVSVSSSNLSAVTYGKVIDFVAIDVPNVVGLVKFHQLCSIPFQISVALFLIYQQLGLASVACVIYALVLIPVTQIVCRAIAKNKAKSMHFKDERMKFVSEVVGGFRIVKFSCWIDVFASKIGKIRLDEMRRLKFYKYLDAFCVFFWQTTPLGMSISSFGLYVCLGNELTAVKVFTCIALFDILILPLNSFPWIISSVLNALISLDRLQNLFTLPSIDYAEYYAVEQSKSRLNISKGRFAWKRSDWLFDLSAISFDCRRRNVIGIIGKVGAGKSSLFNAILAEMFKTNGVVRLSKSDWELGLAVCTQEPWIRRGTIRSNILFGKEYDSKFYNTVIDSCALTDDLSRFPGGDLTDVGENGARLSGGQKARLALARAVYQNKNVYLLDDPFAAVDSNVADHIHKKCINGLLKNKTVVLATHCTNFLAIADWIIIVHDGRIYRQGPAQDIFGSSPIQNDKTDKTFKQNCDELRTTKEEDIPIEEKESGFVDSEIYRTYCKAIGNKVSVAVAIFLAFTQVTESMSQFWLAHWVSSIKESNNSLSKDDPKYFLIIYASIGLTNGVFTFCRAFMFAYGCIQAAMVIHNRLLDKVLKATVKFIEAMPIGRILNRFSSDLNSVDDTLPFVLNILLRDIARVMGTVVVIAYSQQWAILVIVLLAGVYFQFQRYYRKTSREVKRMSSIAMSTVYSQFLECLKGVVTIRAFRQSERVCNDIHAEVTKFTRAKLAESAATTWFALNLETLGVVVATAVSFYAVCQSRVSNIDSAFVGLAISSSFVLNALLFHFVLYLTETEKLVVCVERIENFVASIETERQGIVVDLCTQWPSLGAVKFENVSLRYRHDSPFVIDGVSFEIAAGEKIGIVGRTGAGKSTLFSILFRLVEHQVGNVLVDGIDISNVALHKLRSSIAVIPQDPFLFSGSIRNNLDLSGGLDDETLRNALKLCQLQRLDLDDDIGEQGRELSSGQRQLVCLARAILQNSKILCIDEATANVDLNTDSIIQSTIKSVFKDKTVLTIAHRTETVLHCDRVMVLSNGKIEEFDSPKNLLDNKHSIFNKLIRKNFATKVSDSRGFLQQDS